MSGQVCPSPQTSSFEFELFEGDPDHLRTVVATTPNQITPAIHIDPASLKLKHRIGRGPFGDVWLATHHRSTDDYEQYHEVAIKMLPPISEDHMQIFFDRFSDMLSKCQGLPGVCWLHGVSIINSRICIVMKFYEGSIGDRMARLKGGKLPLSDALRYGIELAQGIQQLHSKGILVLNNKPYNFLLTEHDQPFLGDCGIPSLLLGIPLPSANMVLRLGTPNYMAPEQWQPEVRGPISFETDSWGFGCSIVEMVSGVQPWYGKSVDAVFQSVVIKKEKPHLPDGLPPPVENVLRGCFEYDFRNRPLMADILDAFKGSQTAISTDGGWIGLGNRKIADKPSGNGYSEWLLRKDHLQMGDTVRSRKPPNSCKLESMYIPEGTIVGLEGKTECDGFILVRVHGIHDPLRVKTSTVERVTFGLTAGDWVRLKVADGKQSPVGLLHSIQRDGSVAVGFIGMEILWRGNSSDLQMAESYCVGQFVKVKDSVYSPRFEWPRRRGEWATGRIWQILPNGCLVVGFSGRLGDGSSNFFADPAEIEMVSFSTCQGVVKKYQHLEDFHWAVRPVMIAFGLLAAVKFGLFTGKIMRRSRTKKGESPSIQGDGQRQDSQIGGNSAWLPPPVVNLFREGGGAR